MANRPLLMMELSLEKEEMSLSLANPPGPELLSRDVGDDMRLGEEGVTGDEVLEDARQDEDRDEA